MIKESEKSSSNIFYQLRKDLHLTREKASELLEWIPPEAIEKIENGKRDPRPDEVVQFSKKYKAPTLCNHYCRNYCDIGKEIEMPEIKIGHLSQIIIKILNSLNTVQDKQKKLIEIAEDEIIEDKEIEEFIMIQKDLDNISSAVSSLRIWSEQMLDNGTINIDKYNSQKNKLKK